MISCETCRRAELTPWQRLKEDARYVVLGPPPGAFLRNYAATLVGLRSTAYDRHREEYVSTGDERELARMLRHVE